MAVQTGNGQVNDERYARLSHLVAELAQELDRLEKDGQSMVREVYKFIDKEKLTGISRLLHNNS